LLEFFEVEKKIVKNDGNREGNQDKSANKSFVCQIEFSSPLEYVSEIEKFFSGILEKTKKKNRKTFSLESMRKSLDQQKAVD
jgi:hypothetical protein